MKRILFVSVWESQECALRPAHLYVGVCAAAACSQCLARLTARPLWPVCHAPHRLLPDNAPRRRPRSSRLRLRRRQRRPFAGQARHCQDRLDGLAQARRASRTHPRQLGKSGALVAVAVPTRIAACGAHHRPHGERGDCRRKQAGALARCGAAQRKRPDRCKRRHRHGTPSCHAPNAHFGAQQACIRHIDKHVRPEARQEAGCVSRPPAARSTQVIPIGFSDSFVFVRPSLATHRFLRRHDIACDDWNLRH